MSQRLIHPRTGLPIEPLGFIRGRAVWPILGAAEDDEKDKGKDNNSGTDSGGSGNLSGTGDSGAGEGKTDSSDEQPITKSDLDAVVSRMKAADKRAADAEARVKEFEDKDRTELEKAQAEAAQTKAAFEALNKELRDAKIQNAFLASNKHKWQDAEAALALADLSEVEINDAGKVVGLDKVLDALAKAKPWMLKSDGEGNGGGSGNGPTAPHNAGNNNGSQKDQRAALEIKYPQLVRY